MTKKPITLTPDTMAADAAKIIKSEKIDNIPVINSKKEPIGLLDERNLLEVLP